MEPEWTPRAIIARGLRLLTFMEKRWSLSFGSSEEKMDLLGLRFVSSTEKVSADELLLRSVDLALDRAKVSGRNRVVLATVHPDGTTAWAKPSSPPPWRLQG